MTITTEQRIRTWLFVQGRMTEPTQEGGPPKVIYYPAHNVIVPRTEAEKWAEGCHRLEEELVEARALAYSLMSRLGIPFDERHQLALEEVPAMFMGFARGDLRDEGSISAPLDGKEE